MASRNRKPKGDPLNTAANEGQSMTATDMQVFGQMGSSGREVMKEFLIDRIRPDRRQPRRAIPNAVCGKWDGNPENLGQIFNRWIQMAEQELGEEIAVGVLLDGDLDGPETDVITPMEYPIAHSLMSLIGLASNILKVGLNSPISIVEMGKHWVISTGERRWLAHHLIRSTVGNEEWSKIKARVVKEDVWTQVSENGAREELNAISIARGLALLLMDMYKDEQDFAPYEEIVNSNDTDQAYYAQATDLRVRRGFGNDVLYATGIKSLGMLHRYRQLLTIPESVWLQADVEDWSEFRIRGHVELLNGKPTKTTAISEPTDDYTSTVGEVSAENENQPESTNWESSQVSGQRMATPRGVVGSVEPGQALGRERPERPLLTVEMVQSMTTIELDGLLINSLRWLDFRNGDDVHDIIIAEIQRRREKMGLKDEPVGEGMPEVVEVVERALESEVPIAAEDIVAKNVLNTLMWAAENKKNGILASDIREVLTMSLETIREWIAIEDDDELNEDPNDLEWIQQTLDQHYQDINAFVVEIMAELFAHIWDEAQRMRVKYPFEGKE
jgi:hypothetical protein